MDWHMVNDWADQMHSDECIDRMYEQAGIQMPTEKEMILNWLRERSEEAQREIDHLQLPQGAQLPIEETKRKIQYWSGIRRMADATITWILNDLPT